MNGKAIIGQCVDAPSLDGTRYTLTVTFYSTQGFVATEVIDCFFLPTDTLAQIKTKIRNTLMARGTELGLTILTADVGSIMQI